MTVEERRRRNRIKSKRWRLKHPKDAKAVAKRYSDSHPVSETRRKGQRQWRDKNKAHRSAYNKRWTDANRPRKMANNAKWKKRRLARDPYFRLTTNLRNRVNAAIRSAKAGKVAGTIALVGCDIQFLLGYIEARFKPGMSWSNYGKVWELDHHIPLASYDLTDASHQRSAFHYSNLRPLFSVQNATKGAKLPPPHQAEML